MMSIMKAVVLDAPGPPEALQIRDVPIPTPRPGQVLIKVEAFGLNRSELHTRLGLAVGVTFPRVLGIEATGTVAGCPGGEFRVGQQVATMMGGMGRTFDGGYAEYTCVPARQVVPFTSNLDWATLGAVPEMLQTAYGSLTIGLDAQPRQSILIRGGTSSVGMATTVLAKGLNMTVLSTTRSPGKIGALAQIGADHVLIDDGQIADRVRDILPGGVDTALELVGTPTLPDTLAATKVHGVVCFTGMLSNQWTVSDFYPIDYIPRGVRLTAYTGEATDLTAEILQKFLDSVAAGTAVVPIYRVYHLSQIRQAHVEMEAGSATGKIVVLTQPSKMPNPEAGQSGSPREEYS
jgi:NADPH:quinone reductase